MKSVPLLFVLLLLLPAAASAEPVTINAVGDIMLGGSGEKTFRRRGYDYPFAATAAALGKGDIVIGNLEAPIAMAGEEFTAKKFRFRLSPQGGSGPQECRLHPPDPGKQSYPRYGAEGLRQTLESLAAQGLAFSGAGPDLAAARKVWFTEVRGVRLALLSYSLVYPAEFFAGNGKAGTAPGYEPFFTADIREAKKAADYVIVSFHWGGEGLDTPKPYQKAAGHRAIDAGADIVIGHHPHVLQGVEYYRSGVIFYSLGNFAFGSMSSKADRSIIARITLDNGIKEIEIIPLNVLNREVRFQPRILTGPRAAAVTDHLNRLSREMGTLISTSDGRYLLERDTLEIANR